MNDILENYSLDAIKNKLGVEEAIDMFEYTLSRIPKIKDEILKYIVEKNWEAVSSSAHRTLSSVRLYGTENMEKILRDVKTSAEAHKFPTNIEKEISNEFDFVANRIIQWLEVHKTL